MIFIVLLLNAFIVYFAKSSASLAAAFTLLALAPELSYRSHITHITTTLPYLDSQLEHRTSQPQQPTQKPNIQITQYWNRHTRSFHSNIYVWSRAIRDLDREIRFRSLCIWYLHIGILHILLLPITSFFLSFYVFLLSLAFSSLFWCYYCCYCFGLPTFGFCLVFLFLFLWDSSIWCIQLAYIDISHGSFISFYCHSQNNLHPIYGIITHVFFNFFFHSNSYWNLFHFAKFCWIVYSLAS